MSGKPRVTEEDVTLALAAFMKARYFLPNVYVFDSGRESDAVGVSRGDFVYEFEVKLTCDDLRSEFTARPGSPKAVRWEMLGLIAAGEESPPMVAPDYMVMVVLKPMLACGSVELIPAYAGIISVDVGSSGLLLRWERLPKLLRQEMTGAVKAELVTGHLLKSAYHRFWRLRHKEVLARQNLPAALTGWALTEQRELLSGEGGEQRGQGVRGGGRLAERGAGDCGGCPHWCGVRVEAASGGGWRAGRAGAGAGGVPG